MNFFQPIKIVFQAITDSAAAAIGKVNQALGISAVSSQKSGAALHALSTVIAEVQRQHEQLARIINQYHGPNRAGLTPADINAVAASLANAANQARLLATLPQALNGLHSNVTELRDAAKALSELPTDKLKAFADDAVLLAARVENLSTILNNVGARAGYSVAQLEGFEERVKSMNITTQVARQSMILMSQAQMDVSESAKIARLAQDFAVISGKNSSETFQRVTQAIQLRSSYMLRSEGILMNQNRLQQQFADLTNRSRTSITEMEKRQLVLNEVFRQGALVSGTYEKSLGDVYKQYTSLARLEEESQRKFGEQFIPIFQIYVDLKKKLLEGFVGSGTDKGTNGFWTSAIAGATAFAVVLTTLGSIAAVLVLKFKAVATALGTFAAAHPVTALLVLAVAALTAAYTAQLSVLRNAEIAREARIHAISREIAETERLRDLQKEIVELGNIKNRSPREQQQLDHAVADSIILIGKQGDRVRALGNDYKKIGSTLKEINPDIEKTNTELKERARNEAEAAKAELAGLIRSNIKMPTMWTDKNESYHGRTEADREKMVKESLEKLLTNKDWQQVLANKDNSWISVGHNTSPEFRKDLWKTPGPSMPASGAEGTAALQKYKEAQQKLKDLETVAREERFANLSKLRQHEDDVYDTSIKALEHATQSRAKLLDDDITKVSKHLTDTIILLTTNRMTEAQHLQYMKDLREKLYTEMNNERDKELEAVRMLEDGESKKAEILTRFTGKEAVIKKQLIDENAKYRDMVKKGNDAILMETKEFYRQLEEIRVKNASAEREVLTVLQEGRSGALERLAAERQAQIQMHSEQADEQAKRLDDARKKAAQSEQEADRAVGAEKAQATQRANVDRDLIEQITKANDIARRTREIAEASTDAKILAQKKADYQKIRDAYAHLIERQKSLAQDFFHQQKHIADLELQNSKHIADSKRAIADDIEGRQVNRRGQKIPGLADAFGQFKHFEDMIKKAQGPDDIKAIAKEWRASAQEIEDTHGGFVGKLPKDQKEKMEKELLELKKSLSNLIGKDGRGLRPDEKKVYDEEVQKIKDKYKILTPRGGERFQALEKEMTDFEKRLNKAAEERMKTLEDEKKAREQTMADEKMKLKLIEDQIAATKELTQVQKDNAAAFKKQIDELIKIGAIRNQPDIPGGVPGRGNAVDPNLNENAMKEALEAQRKAAEASRMNAEAQKKLLDGLADRFNEMTQTTMDLDKQLDEFDKKIAQSRKRMEDALKSRGIK